jgi:iron(III) transport system permease protein
MGIVCVMSSVAFAFPFLELRAGFERMDPALEEAARISGCKPWRVFRDVSLPLLWPSLVNGMCLAFLYALASFGVPALLGMPVRKFVLTTLIYSQLKMGGLDGLRNGLRLSLVLLAIAAVVLLLSAWLSRLQRRRGAISGAKSSRQSRVDLGGWRIGASAMAWALLFVTVALPWFALGISALAPVAGHYSPSGWTLANIISILMLPDFHTALLNSFLLTLVVASTVAGVGFLLAFACVRQRSRVAGWIIESFGIPFATPGTVIAIVLIFLGVALTRLGLPFGDSPLLLMALAYALKYAAVGARSMITAFRQIDPALEEAARVSGATTWPLLRTIWLPLLKKSVAAAWLLAALPMLTELTMSVILTGPDAATLGTVLFELQAYRDQASAAAFAWLLLSLALLIGFMTRKEEAA